MRRAALAADPSEQGAVDAWYASQLEGGEHPADAWGSPDEEWRKPRTNFKDEGWPEDGGWGTPVRADKDDGTTVSASGP